LQLLCTYPRPDREPPTGPVVTRSRDPGPGPDRSSLLHRDPGARPGTRGEGHRRTAPPPFPPAPPTTSDSGRTTTRSTPRDGRSSCVRRCPAWTRRRTSPCRSSAPARLLTTIDKECPPCER